MASRPQRYKGLLKCACGLDQARLRLAASLDGLHRAIVQANGRAAPATAAGLDYPELCVPYRKAFRDQVSWSGHVARMHGYRRAHLVGSRTLCRTCGRRCANQHRLRRHLVSVPACVQGWGRFKPADEASASNAIHQLAPPCPAAGMHPAVSVQLLQSLEEICGAAEADVWSCIEEHIEPISVLRRTVEVWRSRHTGSDWHEEISETCSFCLTLQPLLSTTKMGASQADRPNPQFQSGARPGPYATPCPVKC